LCQPARRYAATLIDEASAAEARELGLNMCIA